MHGFVALRSSTTRNGVASTRWFDQRFTHKTLKLAMLTEVWITVSHGTEFDDVNTEPEVLISPDKSNVSMFDFGPSGCDQIAK